MTFTSFDNIGLVKVLVFLKSHKSEYLSGQDLSDVLKISRVAIWKHIKKIRKLGYVIESKQKLGYKLTKETNMLLPWEITDGLKTKVLGKRVYFFDSIDSTQKFALKIAKNPKENGTVVISQEQSGGRGRMGRKWVSPVGGIWCSLIIKPKFEISKTTIVPIASALALSRAIEKTLNKQPKLKWPNDVTINGKKVAGILIDLSLESNKIENLVLGVGINFKINAKKLKPILKDSDHFYGVTSLCNKKENKSPIKLFQTFLMELEEILDLINKKKTSGIVKEWTNRSSTIGKSITIQTSEGLLKGKAIKIDSDGALMLFQNGKTRRVLVGDITEFLN